MLKNTPYSFFSFWFFASTAHGPASMPRNKLNIHVKIKIFFQKYFNFLLTPVLPMTSSSASFQIIKIVELFCKHASLLTNSLPFFSQKCIIKKVFIQKTATPDFSRIAEYNLKHKILNYKLLDDCSNTS